MDDNGNHLPTKRRKRIGSKTIPNSGRDFVLEGMERNLRGQCRHKGDYSIGIDGCL